MRGFLGGFFKVFYFGYEGSSYDALPPSPTYLAINSSISVTYSLNMNYEFDEIRCYMSLPIAYRISSVCIEPFPM